MNGLGPMANILVAEDKDDIAGFVKELLNHDGHDVRLAGNGAEAMDFLSGGNVYDLIITDVIMPVMDGYDLVNYLKKNDIDTPVIAISGGGMTLSAQSALMSLEADVDSLLQKPLSIDDLLAAINNILDVAEKKL
jgi:CheY-like chemotaxis protein